MGKRKKGNRRESGPTYQRKFQEGDMLWLAREYQQRLVADPSLTLEDFAVQYAVPADEIRAHIPELNGAVDQSIVLWHGTTKTRAKSILEEGFRAKRSKMGRIFFARNPKIAGGYARGRARRENDQPAVIMCSIDLNHYDDYEQVGTRVFVFRYECIASDVVRRVAGLSKPLREKTDKKEKEDSETTSVALAFNTARAGIAYWLNSFLNLSGDQAIAENHEAVGKIKEWLDAQTDAGRFGAVPDDEILEQTRKHLPQYLQ